MTKKNFYSLNDNQNELEVCLILFKRCNLNCQFCFQDRSSIEIDDISKIPEKLEKELQNIIKEMSLNKVTYRLWGGELFSDDLDDNLFVVYHKLVNDLYDISDRLNLDTEICFTSNLVFSKVDRVLNLLKDTNSYIATSFDLVGRFQNEQQIDQWTKNAELFQPKTVSITLTKQNINEWLTSDKFKSKYRSCLKKYPLNIEYYIYNRNWKYYQPSDDDIFDLFVDYAKQHLCYDKDNWLNIPEFDAIILSYNNPIGRYCTCNRSCLWINDKLTFNCLKRSSDLPQFEFFETPVSDEDYTDMQVKTALKRRNCFLCRHYEYCRLQCLASCLHLKHVNDNCWLDKAYGYIEQNLEICKIVGEKTNG